MEKENNEKNQQYILHSVETAFSVLDLFFDYEELSPSEVARCLNINRSTAFRFLVTLEQSGYIVRTDSAHYRLGLKVSTLGQLAHSRMELIQLIHPYLAKITETCGESTHLVIMNDSTHVIFIDKSVGSLWLKMDVTIGYTQLAHLTGTGKAILAWESDQFVNQYLREASFEKHTSNSIGDARELLQTLDVIRSQGYSCDNEETEVGLFCLAVPVLSRTGQPVAAISASGPTTRMMANRDSLVALLKEATGEIQKSLKN
ncbi:MAG: IclR family transcriptional regulator [Lachnospiraceae bacterium]|nr:IclR family transcriptional regulator [Lachnospiraceae bacterium]